MTDEDFVRIRDRVYDNVGIVLGDHKKEMVYSRIARRCRHYNMVTFTEYLDYLEDNLEAEFSNFINSITTNLTSFFREGHHFEFLESDVIPELKQVHARDKRVRIWSAGCSTGMEPYSIAMTMADHFKSGWDLKILATDLDSEVLAKAASGTYDAESVTGINDAHLKRWCLHDKSGTQYKIKSELQNLISFKRLNLLQPWPMKGQFDVIFCRNVVIYFDNPTKDELFRRYAQHLRPGGYLILGHSESMSKNISEYENLGKTIYRKK